MSSASTASVKSQDAKILIILVALSLIHGLLYLFIVPPWQHDGEPGHFEYAWLIANEKDLPVRGAFDQAERREIAASMIENNFFKSLDYSSSLLSWKDPIWVGISQVKQAPVYYVLAAVPLWFLRGADVTFQLYYARLVSLILYVITVLLAYAVVAELVPMGHPLRWMVPITIILLPGFTDLMTAVNDDVGATAAFSLFLWTSIRMLRRGFSWLRLASLILLTVLCVFTKSTSAIALILFPITLLFAIFKGEKRRWAWYILIASGAVVCVLILTWGEADFWYSETSQFGGTRVKAPNAPHGSYILAQVDSSRNTAQQIFQLFPLPESVALRGKIVTLGAWIWATEPVSMNMPTLNDGVASYSRKVEVGKEPAFYTFLARIADDSHQLRIILNPQVSSSESPVTVFYDGFALAEGDHTGKGEPIFSDRLGLEGIWGGQPFSNTIRNASAERPYIRIRPWIDRLFQEAFPASISVIVASVVDWPGFSGYYWHTSQNLLRTFWGKFGWSHVPLLGHKPYRPLAVVTLLSIAGLALFLSRKWSGLPKDILFLLGLSLVGIWSLALVWGVGTYVGTAVIPSARYAYPAIIPTTVALCTGWLELGGRITLKLHIPAKVMGVCYVVLFIVLDLYSLVSIMLFYEMI